MLGKHGLEEGLDDMAEDDWIAHLHHRGLEVHREQDTLGLRVRHLFLKEGQESRALHQGGVQDLSCAKRQLLLYGDSSVSRHVVNTNLHVRLASKRLLVGAEVALAHCGDVSLRLRSPFSHRVRVLPCVRFHRWRGSAVRVSLPQHGVHSATLDFLKPKPECLLLWCLWVLRKAGNSVPLVLQLLDRRLELWHRSANVGQLDDVALSGLGKLTQIGQIISLTLLRGEPFGEGGKDSPRE
mmetsp:Transcript_18856/g.21071  ORF Transcript_18856/g.21071 Transcript_18856/m.21071 type:complete len:239 (-) Transcript_18856:155-871(-)